MWFDAGSNFTSSSIKTDWGSYASAARAPECTLCLSDSTDNYLNITGVQLEEGSHATPFEFRPYQQELALCKRYFQKILLKGIPSGGYSAGSGGYDNHLLGVAYPVEMRSNPTLTYDSVGNYQPGGGTGTPSTLYSHAQVLCIKTGSTNNTWQPQVINSDSYAYITAEL